MAKPWKFCAVALLVGTLARPVPAAEAVPTPATDASGQGASLSGKLSESGGVIHPEGSVDPAMAKGVPATGRMPVIPPVGTPGGDPAVQPK